MGASQKSTPLRALRACGEPFFWAAALAAYAFRLAYVLHYPDLWFQDDSYGYFLTTFYWDRDLFFHIPFPRTPLYPLFVFAAAKLAGLPRLPFLQHSLHALSMIGLGLLLRRSLGRTALSWYLGGIFILVSCFFPSQFLSGSLLMAEGLEGPYLFFAVLAFTFFLARRNSFSVILLGVAAAVGLLIRPAYQPMLIAYAAGLLLVFGRRSFGRVALLFACYFACLTPWMAYNLSTQGRFTANVTFGMTLTACYGHLYDMGSPRYRIYKDALRESHKKYLDYLSHRKGKDFLVAGNYQGAGEDSYAAVLTLRFGKTVPDLDPVLVGMAWEGVRAHPREALSLIGRKALSMLGDVPSEVEQDFTSYHRYWAGTDFEESAMRDYDRFFSRYGVSRPGGPERRAREQGARPYIDAINALVPLARRLSPLALWLSLALFPLGFLGKNRELAALPFVFITAYIASVAVFSMPVGRFFQPLLPMVWLLFCLELGAVPDIIRGRRADREND